MDWAFSTHENAHKIFRRKPEGKRPLQSPSHRWDDNIRTYLREMEWEVTNWLHMAQSRDQWQVLVW